MNDLKEVLEQAEIFATKIILDYSDKIIYHDLKFAKRMQGYVDKIGKETSYSEIEIRLSKICAWLFAASFDKQELKINKEGLIESNVIAKALLKADEFFAIHKIDEDQLTLAKKAINEMFFPSIPETRIGMLLYDSVTADIIVGNGEKHIKKIYDEMLLHNVSISRKKWFDIALDLSKNLKFYLPYCQEHLEPQLKELQLKLIKEKKQLEKAAEHALKIELDISDQELKQLKKKLSESKGRDGRGIQTVFRTTIKNHYTLNEMVDRKANIMITVNSIILSLLLGGVIGADIEPGVTKLSVTMIPIMMLTLTAIGSIIFAILSIRPEVTHGQFTEEDVRNKGGNLLYYGNFHDMQMRDYEWGFLQMMNDQDYLYTSMIKDIFYLGKNLKKKYSHIRLSLTIFLIGLTLAVISNFVIRMAPCF